MTNDKPYEVQLEVKYSPAGRYFEFSVPMGRMPFTSDGAANALAKNWQVSFEEFVTADGEHLRNLGRAVQGCILLKLLSDGIGEQDALMISESLREAEIGADRADEELVVAAIRRVVAHRMVGIAGARGHKHSLSDLPKLFDVALLLGDEEFLKMKQRWPKVRRALAALSAEEDLEKRRALGTRLDRALKGE